MSKQAATKTVEITQSLVREYLQKHDNGRGEAYVKANEIAEEHEDMNARRAGRGLAAIENGKTDDVGVERWGKSRATQWRVFYTQ